MDDVTYARLTSEIQRLLGLDLGAYKSQQMRRRITSFIEKEAAASPHLIVTRLRRDPELLAALRDMITINVTDFFRDAPQWTLLEGQMLPRLAAGRRGLRVWSAGCSRGQEPLSLAITLDRLGILDTSRILATDFDREVLARARAGGPYSFDEMRGITTRDRARYFEPAPGGFVARRELRQNIRHQELNLLRDPFERGFDLIVCRNVMIYFENHVKTELVSRFQQSLRPDGLLFIGATEALLGRDLEGFERIGGNFYRRTSAADRRAA